MQIYNTYKSTHSTLSRYIVCCVFVLGIEFWVLGFVKQIRSETLAIKY